MPRRTVVAVAVVLFAALLFSLFAAGTPVAGDDSIAAVTAGINLGTAPTPRVAPTGGLVPLRTSELRTLLGLLCLILLAGTGYVATSPVPDLQSIHQRAALGRRGPPTTA